jgi:hypothetical protein
MYKCVEKMFLANRIFKIIEITRNRVDKTLKFIVARPFSNCTAINGTREREKEIKLPKPIA